MKKYLLILFIVLSLNTCTYNTYTPNVCFQQNVLPIFISNCSMSGCHNSIDKEEDLDLTNYEGIMKGIVPSHPLLSKIFRSIKGKNPNMPVGGKLSDKDVSTIENWIKMGAPNTINCENSCDTSNVSYLSNIKPIINNWCLNCHNSVNTSGNYDFSVYSGVVKSIGNNRLLGSIKQLSGYSPMPSGNKLSDCDIAIVEKWVSSGYPNN